VETRVLLLRHAESAEPDRFHGAESDVGLGERGRRQAIFLAEELRRFKPDSIICSGLRRALETAQPIAAACGLELEVIEALHERRMGALSGLAKAEHGADYIAELERWKAGNLDFARDDAESYRQVLDRARPVLQAIAARQQGRTVVIVTHGLLIRIVLSSLLDEFGPARLDQIGFDNGAIHDLRWNGHHWRAVALNLRPVGLP
jgi:probable phosphoglycerate mutase